MTPAQKVSPQTLCQPASDFLKQVAQSKLLVAD